MNKKKHPKEVVVIFDKYQDISNTIIYRPIDLEVGYLDSETNEFVTKNGRYHYILDEEYQYGFGLRMSKEKFKTIFQLEGTTLKEAAYNCLSILKNFEFYFITQEKEQGLFLTFMMEDIRTHNIVPIQEPDIEIAVLYLIKSILGKDFDKNDIELKTEIYESSENISSNEKLTDIKNVINSKSTFDFEPKKITEEIKKNIIGQDEAIDDIVTIIWQNQKSDNKSNILLIGPSGVGKTEIIRNLTNKLNIPMAKINVTDTSQAAYVGTSLTDSIKQLVRNANYDIEKASKGIIFIDEIDKKASLGGGDTNSNLMTSGVQDELLKLLEDNDYEVNISKNPNNPQMVTINTKNITFICAGAFSNMKEVKKLATPKTVGFNRSTNPTTQTPNSKLPQNITRDDLVKYGLKTELIGRLHNIIELSPLTKEDLINIMKNPNNKNIQDKIKILNSLGINLTLDDEVYSLLAEKAIKNNTGARGLVSEVDSLFRKAMKAISYQPNDYEELIINKETVNNPNAYKLVKRKK